VNTEITDNKNDDGWVCFDVIAILFIYLPLIYLLAAWKGETP
jgi:hypothetical protein